MKKYAIYRTDGTFEILKTKKLTLEQLQKIVDGNIEAYTTVDGDYIYLNEEGRLQNLPRNPFYAEDLRGNVIVTAGLDEEGEDKGLPEDYKLRELAQLPKQLFEKDKKFTIFWIADSMPMTVKSEIKTCGYKGDSNKPIFKVRGKRTASLWRTNNSELMIFEDWDIPLKVDSEIQRKATHGFGSTTMRMNAMYNLGGMKYEEMREYIKENQINPFFILYDHINYINGKNEDSLLYPEAPATNQRIADMQSKQLKDGIFRIVV